MAGGWLIEGRKAFCSGAGTLQRALVTADAPDGPRLFDIDVSSAVDESDATVKVCPESWPAVGMAASDSSSVNFERAMARESEAVGGPHFYTSRPGFWWGAAGVAACWWGGAGALLETVGDYLDPELSGDVELAAYGSALARHRAMTETLRWAASQIDEEAANVDRVQRAARVAREVVHVGCMAILEAAAAAGGARPICLDADQSRRSADLYAYLAQHHGGRDAASMGRAFLREGGRQVWAT
jgi:alkylation response protein AidB-like acyl-CoA dehydrogenase